MKKFLGVCLSLVLFASCCGVLVGCGNNYNVNLNLDKYSVNITDAASLGVAQIDGKMKLIKTSKLLLADGTSEPSYTEVEYKDENGNLFDIDKTELEVYQMYVTPDYTFVSYISQNVRKYGTSVDMYYKGYWAEGFTASYNDYYLDFYDLNKNIPEDFNKTEYRDNKLTKSYIIDNDTGKMYSPKNLFIDHLGYFSIINNLIYVSSYENSGYYSFYTNDNDELIFNRVVNNKDLLNIDVYRDINGYNYVSNDDINTFDAENNTLYTTEELTLGSDGYVYEDNNLPQLCRLNGNSREMLTSCDDVVFQDGKYIRKVENNVLYSIDSNWGKSILNCYDISNNFTMFGEISGKSYDSENDVLYNVSDDGIYIYSNFDVRNNKLGEATKVMDEFEFVYNYSYLDNGIIRVEEKVIKEVTPSETNYYKFGKDENGNATLIKLANTQYTGTIITLQPIN